MQNAQKAPDFDLSDPALTAYISESEAKLRFPAFNPDIAHKLGEVMRSRFTQTHDASDALYLQIRPFPSRPGAPFVLYATMDKLGAGIAYQIEGKARIFERGGMSTFGAKAFAAMMGWKV